MQINTKYLLFATFFMFSLPFFVLAGDISQIVFTNDPRAIKPNEVSEIITIEAQDASGSQVKNNTICLQITSSSQTGEFSTNKESWSTESIRILNLTLATNQYRRNFYYKDSNVGSYIIMIKAALKPEDKTCPQYTAEGLNSQWTATQNIVVSDTGAIASQSQSPEPTSDVGSGGSSWPVEPQIYANAGEDKISVAGADIEFRGQALGLEKEPLDNARYLWNFGDGSIKEGQNVLHSYKYPAEYIITLDVSSGKYSASDRAMVKVVPNKISISEATSEFIKLKNGSDVTLDISGWFLKGNGTLFRIPENTFIKENTEVPIPSAVSGINTVNVNSEILFLYPNGSTAFSYVAQKPKIILLQEIQKPQKESKIVETEPLQPESVPVQQTASIIDSIPKDSYGTGKWFFIVLGIGIIAGVSMVIIRRKI